MGTPAPYTNLAGDNGPTPTGTMLGTVTSVTGDGTHANVDVAGSTWTVSIPGSVHGVTVGRSVSVRTEGNVRRVENLVTVIPKETYNTSDQGQRSINTSLPGNQYDSKFNPGGGNMPMSYWGGNIGRFYVDTSPTGAIGISRRYIDQLETRLGDINSRFNTIHNIIDTTVIAGINVLKNSLGNGGLYTGTNSSAVNQLSARVDQLTKMVETLSSDLREQGLLK